jgi:hypothetical protein
LVGAGFAGASSPELHAAPFPGGAALHTDSRAWLLLDDQPARRLGWALAWADQRGPQRIDLLTDTAAGTLARRASCFERAIDVWWVDDDAIVRAEADEPHVVVAPPEQALDLVPALHDAGLDIVIEHGQVRGEILGLEVARVHVDGGSARIEVGVGRHDRDAFALVHGDVPTGEALATVAGQVRRHRRPGDLTHPLARLAPEGWLRTVLIEHPAMIGAATLEPVEATLPRVSVKDPSPAIATGRTATGAPLVVACSVGVDLDLVPAASDARLAYAPDATLVLAVPERDAVPVTRRLAATLDRPAEVVTVANDFRG